MLTRCADCNQESYDLRALFVQPDFHQRVRALTFRGPVYGKPPQQLAGDKMARIALINPRFGTSYWGMEYVMPIVGKKANVPVSALPLIAALTPKHHEVILVDENVEAVDFDRLCDADIVGVTGMSVQRFRMREIVEEFKRRGKFVVVGGAWASVQEDYFADVADVQFIGEADESWPEFLAEWEQGRYARRYRQANRTDMTRLPVPRFDLLKTREYLFGAIQTSRGCPFLCEFCDIIVTFGRRPRTKAPEQVIAELDALRALGVRQVFIVDDNFVGDKRAAREQLRWIIDYQERHGFPFRLFTEASLDLAEDDELTRLMADANITSVFVGLESPSEEALKQTRKMQNVKPGAGTMQDRVRRIQDAGIEVWCGMIVGFDSDDETIFDRQMDFLEQTAIPHIMIGMLCAIPGTPLYSRLLAEGRLDTADRPAYGTNVIPARMSREALRDGYLRVMDALHGVDAYFGRLEELYVRGRLKRENLGRVKFWQRNPLTRAKQQALNLVGALLGFRQLMKHVDSAALRREYRARIWRAIRATRDPGVILTFIGKCAMHFHYDRLVRELRAGTAGNSFSW